MPSAKTNSKRKSKRNWRNINLRSQVDWFCSEISFFRIELIEGILETDSEDSLGGNLHHGSVKSLMASSLNSYLLGKKLPPALVSVDVIFPLGIISVVPDIVLTFKRFTSEERTGFFEGVPDLIVEIIDSASYIEDTIQKPLLYASQGVPEYWLVFPEVQMILVYQLNGGQYKLASHAVQNGIIHSAVLPDFVLDLKTVFLDYT